MFADDLYVDLFYDSLNNEITLKSNVTDLKVGGLITDFLMTQLDAQEDDREPNRAGKYIIRLELDLIENSFTVSKDNTGNNNLRDDILLRCANYSLSSGIKRENYAHGMGQ